MKKYNVLVTGGGTGGHFYPALSIYNEFQKQESVSSIIYFGSKNGIETELVKKYDMNYKIIFSYGFYGKNIFYKLKSVLYNIIGLLQVIYFFIFNRIDLVIGTGGYVTLPVLVGAVILKKRIYLQEQNSYPGITNRYFSKFAKKIFTPSESVGKYLKKSDNMVISPTPVRENFFNINTDLKNEIINDIHNQNKKLVLIFGGSQGSRAINKIINKTLDYLKKNFFIFWITGKTDFEIYKNLSSENVYVTDYCDYIYNIMYLSAIVVSRAGAVTLTELKILNKKAILIPFKAATHNHQYYNAIDFCKNYSGEIIKEDLLTSNILIEKLEILNNNNNIKSNIIENPVKKIVDEILS